MDNDELELNEDSTRTRISKGNDGEINYRYRRRVNKNVKVDWTDTLIEIQIIETDF